MSSILVYLPKQGIKWHFRFTSLNLICLSHHLMQSSLLLVLFFNQHTFVLGMTTHTLLFQPRRGWCLSPERRGRYIWREASTLPGWVLHSRREMKRKKKKRERRSSSKTQEGKPKGNGCINISSGAKGGYETENILRNRRSSQSPSDRRRCLETAIVFGRWNVIWRESESKREDKCEAHCGRKRKRRGRRVLQETPSSKKVDCEAAGISPRFPKI